MSRDDWFRLEENEEITLFHDKTLISLDKTQFEACFYEFMKELFDTSLIGSYSDAYVNAFEWLLANLNRTSGIQLYNDGEIRLNITPSRIEDNKKCIFLKEDSVKDRNLDFTLYIYLYDIIYGDSSSDVS